MGRSLYRALNRRFGTCDSELTRREAFRVAAAVGAALMLSGMAPGLVRPVRRGDRKRVVVIGAGLAGLVCAFELLAAGYDVIVLEARERVGGRVLSFGPAFGNEFIAGRTVEGGGEFIGTNHPLWCAYAEKFKLERLPIVEAKGLAYPVVIGGKRLENDAASALWDSMAAALNTMNAPAAGVDADRPWLSPKADELDKRSIQSWIDALDADAMTKRACWITFCGDNGVDPTRSSLLGQLAAVKGGGLEKYWTETEAWRCKGGNALLARKFAEEIGEDLLHTGTPVRSVRSREGGLAVQTKDGRTFNCDDVVLAVPPSVWGSIEFEPGLPAGLKPQMGVNVKFLAHTQKRFWIGEKASSDALSDGPVHMTWDATQGQDGEANGCLTAFSGGPSAAACIAFAREKRDESYGVLLAGLYPRWKEEFVKSRFMDWTSDPFTRASYSFPAPGQLTTEGPLLERGAMEQKGSARLHFAGEHCCPKFVGYMEGALQSGVAVAKQLADRDGVGR